MKLLLGNFGAGKTSHILQQVAKLPTDQYWIIVPSRRHKDQLYYQLLSEAGGIIGNPIITLSELHKIILKTIFPVSQPRTLSNFEQFLLITSIIQQHEDKFIAFKKLSQRPEVVKMIYRLVQSLRTKNIDHLASSPELADKIHDLQLILHEFQRTLTDQHLCDSQQEILLIQQHPLNSSILPEYIFVDGFVDLTANQLSLISYLAEQAISYNKNITITLTDAPHSLCTDTINIFKEKFPQAEIHSLESSHSALSDCFLTDQDNPSTSIELSEIQAFGKYKEVEEITNQIKKLCLYEDYNLTDIMIICKQQDIYAPLISAILRKAHIPFVFSKDMLLSQNPLILFIKKILSFHLEDLTHETIEFFAHSNYVKSSFRNILANAPIIFPKAIKGKKEQWATALNNFIPDEEQVAEFEKFKSLTLSLCDQLYSLDSRKEHDIKTLIDHLIHILEFLGVQDSLAINTDISYHQKLIEESLAKDFASISKLKEVLNQLKQSLITIEKTSLTLGMFIFYINTITDETRYRSEIPRRKALHILSPEDARGSFTKAVFILGLNEGEFPSPPSYELFDNQDRNSLNKISQKVLGQSLWETDVDYFKKEKLSFATALSRATHHLFLSRTPANEKGTYFGCSHFLRKVLEKGIPFKRIPEPMYSSNKAQWDNPQIFEHKQPAQHYYEPSLLTIVQQTSSQEIIQATNYIKNIKDANDTFDQNTLPNSNILPYFGFLPSEHPIAKRYQQDEIFTSPTGLEKLGRCRYQGLWQGIWKLKVRSLPKYTPEAADYGNLYHYVLEHYIAETKDRDNEDFFDETLLHNILQKFIQDSPQKNVFNLDYNYMFTILSLFLQNIETQFREDQQALYFELASGEGELSQNIIPLNSEKSLKVYSRIDRVNKNIYDNGYHIIDYKKGGSYYEDYQKSPFNLFQGFLYSALLKANNKSPINSISYVLLEKNDQFVEYPKKKNTFNSLEEYYSFKITEILQLISLLSQGNFAPFTLSDDIGSELHELFEEKISAKYKKEYPNKCKYCELQTLCLRKSKLIPKY